MKKELLLGLASIDITPPVGVTLWGYAPRSSTFIEHRLRAEALACGQADCGWILVTADIGAFSAPLTDQVREQVAQRTCLSPDAVLLAATHTHSGPHVTDAFWRERSELESCYFRELSRKLVAVSVAAWRSRTAGELVYGQTSAPELASNRRIQREDGTWTNRFRDPEGSNPGYYDPIVDLVGIRRPGGRLAGLMVNYGCHPVAFGSMNEGISGDYVSHMKDAIEASGQVDTVLFTVSGHANIDPRDGCQSDSQVVKGIGESLASRILEALAGLEPVPGYDVSAAREPWEFTTNWNITDRMTIYFPFAGHGDTVRTALSAVRAGDLVFLGLPGETVSEYRAIFRERSPFRQTLLVSLANDFVGYLPTDEIHRQGAYEADISPLRPLQDVLLERADAVLNKLCI